MCIIIRLQYYMVIDEEILLKNKAEIQEYKAGETIFLEGSLPKYYFQIRSGLAKLNTYREDGSEFIHSIPSDGHCFAETFLWCDVPYCINAESVSDTVIIKLGKSDFMQMLSENKDLTQNLLRHNSERMYYRHKMLATLSINNPSHRIYRVLEFLKNHHGIKEPFEFIVPFSRQQIANLTGLRVETVIRTVKKLEQENLVRISDGRICV
ncbi:Crp/Fnr family transcriptional regulator [Chryseobacterium sp. 2TAF14]|uniref:Crp/Fnr family transcriptional regulator n=1 Tax=Chryseobacterium sp. 2TAF14 TaxID=3233007 RepID=UPI003F930AA4